MVRLALIGTMDEAATFARLVSRIREAQIVALVVPDARAARTADVAFEIIASDFTSLLAHHAAQFDAVVFLGDRRDCLSDCHLAAEAGKHMLVQELFALSSHGAASLKAACENAGVRLMAGDSLRFHPQVQAIWKSRCSGQLGEPGLLRMHCWERAGTNRSVMVAAIIDLAIWMFGKSPNHLYAIARSEAMATRWQNYEYLQAHLGFDGGGMVLVDHARTLPSGDDYFSLMFVGSDGAAYADDQHNVHLLYCGGRPTALRADLADCQMLGALREFVAAIEGNRQPLASGADFLHALRTTDAIAESLASGTAIVCARQPEFVAGVT
jgi:predicted dehydrogenase